MNEMQNLKKNEVRAWICLGILATVYNIVVFALPFPKRGVFWISWLFAMLALAAQVYVIRISFFRNESIKSKFYGFPIAKIGVVYLAVQLALSFLCIVLGAFLPLWIPTILSAALLGIAAIGLIAADAVREEVERQDVVLKKDVSRMRKFQAQTKSLAANSRSMELPKELKDALEALSEKFRYSDPVSRDALAEIEDTIADDLAHLTDAVALLKTQEATELCRKTEADLVQRNALCKANKVS